VLKFIGFIFIKNLIRKFAVFGFARTPFVKIQIKITNTLNTRATYSFVNIAPTKYA
jgi:hypothetical protein